MIITKRKLANAIKRAVEDCKFGRLDHDKAVTKLFWGNAIMYWEPGACGNSKAYAAYIRARNDGTIYISYPDDVNPNGQFVDLVLA